MLPTHHDSHPSIRPPEVKTKAKQTVLPPRQTRESFGQPIQKAKDMLMRVGFEPTPFRTSDCMMYQKVTP